MKRMHALEHFACNGILMVRMKVNLRLLTPGHGGQALTLSTKWSSSPLSTAACRLNFYVKVKSHSGLDIGLILRLSKGFYEAGSIFV